MRHHARSTVVLLASASALLALATPAALGGRYDVTHKFDLKFKVRPGHSWEGRWDGKTHADARDIDEGPVVDDSAGTFTFPPADGDWINADASTTDCYGDANVLANANGLGQGMHNIWGEALVTGPHPINSHAKSESYIYKRTKTVDGKGRVRFGGWVKVDSLVASTKARDPLTLDVTDLDTGERMVTMPWDVESEVLGASTVDWNNNLLTLTGEAGRFRFIISSPFLTSSPGGLEVRYEGGVIVSTIDDGLFDGLLPAVGTPIGGGIVLPLSNEYDLDFDFGAENVNGFDIGASIGSDAETAVPAPGAFGLGVFAVALGARRRR